MNAISTTSRPCVICSGPSAAEDYCMVDDLSYVRCSRCNLIYVDRFADDAQMRGAYSGGSLRRLRRRLLARFRRFSHHKNFDQSMVRARAIYAFAASRLAGNGAPMRFLDIGCNKGFLLAAAMERGAEVYGIELVQEIMIPFCNSYPHLRERIYSDKLSEVAPRLGDDFFDLITAIDVVEHFEDPIGDMMQIHRMLRPGGLLTIQTPDAGCAQARAAGGAWGALKPLEHLHLFNRENFATLARAVGFREIEMYEPFEHADGNFVAVLRK